MTPRRNSSQSSSSNGQPSEPTVDYSSWFPRSYQILPMAVFKPKPNCSHRHQVKGNSISLELPCSQILTTIHGLSSLLIAIRDCNQTTATENHSPIPNAHKILPLRIFSLTSIPSPIIINHLSFLTLTSTGNSTDIDGSTSVAKLHSDLYSLIAHPPSQPKTQTLSITPLPRVTYAENLKQPTAQEIRVAPCLAHGPTQTIGEKPNTPSCLNAPTQPHAIQAQITSSQTNSPLPNFTVPVTMAHGPDFMSNRDFTPPVRHCILELHPNTNGLPTLQLNPATRQTYKSTPAPFFQQLLHSVALPADTNQQQQQPYLEPSFVPDSFPLQQTNTRDKRKRLPTRRSQRLQEKRRPSTATPVSPTRPKNKMPKLPFTLQSQEIPLDADTTLTILQASGLVITQDIQNMIQEVVDQDNRINGTEVPVPTTPLHDIIPPRIMPGENLVL